MNNDGQVDYLRVVELNEGYTHVVILQAVLGRNIYQDVASILLGRSQKSTVYLQVIGDPYIYGSNYIIEPIFGYMPPIFSFFWRNNYTAWNSPYYWGYYPNNYKTYRPYSINDYNKNIGVYIDNSRMNYNYGSQIRNQNYDKMRKTLSRRDYEISNPNRSFSARNQNRSVVNKRDFERRSSASTIRKDVDDKDNTRRQSSRVTNTRQQPKNRDYAPTVVRGRRDSNVVRVQKGEQIDRRGSRDVVVNRNSDEVTRKSVKRNKTSVRSTRKNRNRIYSDSPRRSRSSSRTR
ncbi:MAG: hypothetical protein CR965_02365 [Paludibacter sp.]|nr:MAG: hypothetical protein CR965_02365 [Paludibacter sp.]